MVWSPSLFGLNDPTGAVCLPSQGLPQSSQLASPIAGSSSQDSEVVVHALATYSHSAILNGSSGKLCGVGQERDAGPAVRAMAPPLAPDEGMTVRIPVLRCLRNGGGDLVPGLEATPGQGERAQDLPPGLNQVEVRRVFRLEHP